MRLTHEIRLYLLGLVYPQIVNNEDDAPPDMPAYFFQERDKRIRIHRASHHLKVQPRPHAVGRASNHADDRAGDPPSRHLQDGCSAFRSPCSPDHGFVRERRFIGKPDTRTTFHPLFWMAGHSSCFHLRIAASLRLRYRVSGFWQLQPRARMMRQTYPG